MKPTPTGRVRTTERGADLVITRRFRASIEDVWTSVTDPESSARWFGRWEGEPGVGKTIRLQMGFEEGQPWLDATIRACEPPRHLALYSKHDHGESNLELTLEARGEETVLTFVDHLPDASMAGDYGPGWEYYFDQLVAAREGRPLPVFTDYHPAQKPYFLGEARED